MNNYEDNSFIYPPNYDKLVEERARKEERQRQQELAQALTDDLATVAVAACIGIPGFDNLEDKNSMDDTEHTSRPRTVELNRSFGRAAFLDSNVISFESRPSYLTAIQTNQFTAVTEADILGHATRQVA